MCLLKAPDVMCETEVGKNLRVGTTETKIFSSRKVLAVLLLPLKHRLTDLLTSELHTQQCSFTVRLVSV